MFRELEIKKADGTSEKLGFKAVATTAYRYKSIFGKDLLTEITRLIDARTSNVSESADFSTLDKMAYIMNCQAEGKDLTKLNFDTFLEWLEAFESCAFLDVFTDLVEIYLGNKKSTAEPKKEDAV